MISQKIASSLVVNVTNDKGDLQTRCTLGELVADNEHLAIDATDIAQALEADGHFILDGGNSVFLVTLA